MAVLLLELVVGLRVVRRRCVGLVHGCFSVGVSTGSIVEIVLEFLIERLFLFAASATQDRVDLFASAQDSQFVDVACNEVCVVVFDHQLVLVIELVELDSDGSFGLKEEHSVFGGRADGHENLSLQDTTDKLIIA